MDLLTIALISLIAAISPGPDFFIVFRNSLVYSRRAGLWTAFGVSTAIIIHLTYTLVGIGLLIAKSPFIYALLKYLGVTYLFYIGLKSVISSFKQTPSVVKSYNQAITTISNAIAFTQGFWTNLLNPKATLFFVSLYSQFIDANMPFITGIVYGMITWSIVLGWFSFLAYILTHRVILRHIDQFRIYIDRVMGGVLMALAFI